MVKTLVATPDPDGIPVCDACGQQHIARDANGVRGGQSQACKGHVVYDRDSYVKGQPRKRLDKPRPCGRTPMAGQEVCAMHGGKARQNIGAVATRVIIAEATAMLAHEGVEGFDDPIAEIGRLAQEALALKRALGARVNALDEMRYTGGLERDEDGELRGTGTEQTRAEFLAYERAMDRQMRFLEVLVKHAGMGNVAQTKAMLTRIGEAFGIDE